MLSSLKHRIEKTIEHWERMIRWVKKRKNKKAEADEEIMERYLGEGWHSDDCDLCTYYIRGKAGGCEKCILAERYGRCHDANIGANQNAWIDVANAATWEQWLAAAPKLLKQLKRLLEEPKKKTGKQIVTKEVKIRIVPQSSMGYSSSFQCMDDGKSSPEYGYGLPLGTLLEEEGFRVGNGAIVKVTIELVRQGRRPAKNPWNKKKYPW